MPSTIAEFRQRLYREVMLPSGLSVRLRRVPSRVFLGLGELPRPAPGHDDIPATPENLAQLKRFTDRAVAAGVVDPPMTDALDDGGAPVCTAQMLHVSELEDADYAALSQAILTWSGLAPEVAADIDAFRADGQRPDGAAVGGTLPHTALGDSGPDAGGVVPEYAAHVDGPERVHGTCPGTTPG